MTAKRIPRITPPHAFEDYRYLMEPLDADQGGGFLVRFPELPGCMADGETQAEALSNARDAFAAWMSARIDAGKPIPAPVARRSLQAEDGLAA